MVAVIVDVMPKPEILDPQGQAIARALPSLGFAAVTSVRQGKRFEIEVADEDDPLGIAERAAAALLANPVIEDFTVHIASPVSG
jgi:phosphoribosylformylglycinamidine synthase subunit PurS